MATQYQHSGTATSTTAVDLDFPQPHPLLIQVINDGPDDLLVASNEGNGGEFATVKFGDPPYVLISAKGDINRVSVKVASGESAAYRVQTCGLRDVIGGGGIT